VNFELPNVPEDYVHRIGRTGRAGNEGEAMSLVCIDEMKLLQDIERLIKAEIPKEVIDGFEPDPSIRAEPIQNGRQKNNGRKKPAAQNRSGRSGKAARPPRSSSNRQHRSKRSTESANPWV
jgi:ATP-dependent RNA helicase RhlE